MKAAARAALGTVLAAAAVWPLGLGGGLGLGLGRAAAAESWNLYIHQSAPQFTTSLGGQQLADGITGASGGALEVRRHLAGTLQIKSSDITQAVGQNIVQMGDDLFYSGNVPIGALLRLPFLIQSYEEYAQAEAVVMPYIEKAYAQNGVIVLGGYLYPLQYVWARGAVGALDDIKGMKVRVSSPEQGAFVDRLGGNPVTMSASEVPSALDRGVVDGLVTGSVGADLWQDLLKSGYLIGLSFNNAYIIANAEAFKGLSPELQATVRAEVTKAATWNQETMRSDDGKIIDRLKADPKFAVAEPTDAERTRAAAALAPYWEEWAKERGPEAVEALQKVRALLGR
jgi:TRAP-type C4-dicarboxylate transport system substrate-binding protein